MGIKAISHHVIRSLLTILGIIIGIAGIITTFSIGRGAQKKTREQILSHGSKVIEFHRGNWMSHQSTRQPKEFTEEEIELIASQIETIEYITPAIRVFQAVLEYGGTEYKVNPQGFRPCGFSIFEYKIDRGIFFTTLHEAYKENVIVIDHKTSQAIFGWQNPINKVVRIMGIPFTIIGTLKKPKIEWRKEPILDIFMPFATAKKYFLTEYSFDTFFLTAYNTDSNGEIIRQAVRILRATHHLNDDEPSDFMYYDKRDIAEAAEKGAQVVGLFALIAASIALLVAGIGIMNIMLVAVKERTREIGLKLSMGATQKMILLQFLFESIILCLFGGLGGIVVGLIAIGIISSATNLPSLLELWPMMVALSITLFIGLFFGLYPALQAARLNPVDALAER